MADLTNTIIDGDPFSTGEGGGESGEPFTGATASTDGTQGDVPKPLAGQQNATLFGDGSWKTLLYDALSRYENAVTGRSYTYSGDLNDIMQNCIVNTYGSNANRPSGTSNWGFVVTLMHSNSANYATQIYVTMNEADTSKNMFFRDKNNGTWQSWKRLLTENDLTSINTAIGNKQDKLTNPLTQSDVVDNLTSSSTTYPLSAAQGKALKGSIDTLNTNYANRIVFSTTASVNQLKSAKSLTIWLATTSPNIANWYGYPVQCIPNKLVSFIGGMNASTCTCDVTWSKSNGTVTLGQFLGPYAFNKITFYQMEF